MSYSSIEEGPGLGAALAAGTAIGLCIGLSVLAIRNMEDDNSTECSEAYSYPEEVGEFSCRIVTVEVTQG